MADTLPARLEPFLEPIVAMCRSQFPRSCGSCTHRFENFEEYIRVTAPLGTPGTLFEQKDDDPFGVMSWVNCRCGSTLVLHCEDMKGPQHRQFMQVVREESDASGRSVSDLLLDLRHAIRRRAGADV